MGFPMQVRVSSDAALRRQTQTADTPRRRAASFNTSTDLFGLKLGEFCNEFSRGLEGVNEGPYKVDAIELYVEVTPRGEIRVVASAATDVSGAIKLTFSPRQE
jgi:hypothetical protein